MIPTLRPALAALLLLLTGSAAAQDFMEGFETRFAKQAPRVGELLGDAHGFRADGTAVRLHDLRDGMTILVSGCLT